MMVADRLALLEMCGIYVALAPGGQPLEVTGPTKFVEAATPKLRLHREVVIKYLKHHETRGAVAIPPPERTEAA